jgi:hypothetical protein
MPNTKVVEKIQIYLLAKVHIFLRSLNISTIFILPYWFIQLEKEFKNQKMVVGRFLHAGPALHRAQAAHAHAPQLLMVGTHPSALSLAPIPRLCSAHMATPVALPPMSRPPVTASVPQRSHLCAHTLELSHHSLMLCGITSVLSLLALPPLLRQLGMPRQELDDEALKQPLCWPSYSYRKHAVQAAI